MTKLQKNKFTCLLEERCLIKASGADAESFLQNLVTNDVNGAGLVYACLLTPQGRFLHDFFISKNKDGFYLECETTRRDDLIRRLNVFKLRAKVTVEDCSGQFDVYVSTEKGTQDPRLPSLPKRFYLPKNERIKKTDPSSVYKDLRISLGVPEGTPDMKPEVDTISDANLDLLNAVSWDKGCYVGQEVTARMKNRALVKKRMAIVTGEELGTARVVNSSGSQGLAVVKLERPA
jgi:hypothetical protein